MTPRAAITTRVKIGLLISLVSAIGLLHTPEGAGAELAERRKTFKEWLSKLDNAKATVQFKEVERLPEGRVQETVYRGDWKARNGERRISYYVEKSVDGKKEVFDIRDALLGPNLSVVWFHAGFPGEVHFGKRANRGGAELLYEAEKFASAFQIMGVLQKWFDDPSLRVEPTAGGDEVVFVPTSSGDRIELTLAKRYGFLPERIRRPALPKLGKGHAAGGALTFEYTPGPDGVLLPKRIAQDEPRAPEATGIVLSEWVFTDVKLNPKLSEEEMTLFLPSTLFIKNEDTGDTFHLDEDSQKAKEFLAQMPKSVKVTGPNKAKVELAKTAAAKAPYYPKGFFDVTPEAEEADALQVQTARKRWRYWALAGVLGTVVLAAAAWLVRRRQHPATEAPGGAATNNPVPDPSDNQVR